MLKTCKDINQLKKLNLEELKTLSEEIRDEIIFSVSKNGGHIASSLGTVELSLALHYVFDSPNDSIIWDVGHQAYAHKLLTGRKLDRLRRLGGVCGFPKPGESEHDLFTAGHAGVSISQAAAMAHGNPNNFSIAVIGDGSMTAGMAYEAMNHAGSLKLGNLIVILNDNEMSISKNVGAVSSFLSNNIVNTTYYQKIRAEIKSMVQSFPLQKAMNIDLINIFKKLRTSALSFIAPESFFEGFGFRYVGPIDGHDTETLIKTFTNIPKRGHGEEPLLIHVITKKGMGFTFAEDDPCLYHGIGSFDPDTGKVINCSELPSFTTVFGRTMMELGRKDNDVVAITAAMEEGTGLSLFAKKFPKRFFDVGIAEQHAVTFGSALAKTGKKPVVAIYSSFMQRCLDQVIHDVALNNLHVVMCMDRSGIVGEDGPTHHGLFDISFLRNIPNLTIMAPSTAGELRSMMYKSLNEYKTPVLVRYPRGIVPSWESAEEGFEIIDHGKARVILDENTDGDYISVFAIGHSTYFAKLAAQEFIKTNKNIGVRVYDGRFIKPLDKDAILFEAQNSIGILTVEENMLAGGWGSSIVELCVDNLGSLPIRVKRLGISDNFVEHGSPSELRSIEGLDIKSILNAIESLCDARKVSWIQRENDVSTKL